MKKKRAKSLKQTRKHEEKKKSIDCRVTHINVKKNIFKKTVLKEMSDAKHSSLLSLISQHQKKCKVYRNDSIENNLSPFSPSSVADLCLQPNTLSEADLKWTSLLNDEETTIVDVEPDGSCLFHSVFASAWLLQTGQFIVRHSYSALEEFWKAALFYDIDLQFEKFDAVQYKTTLGAIWHACTRSMRLYVAATLAFGTQTLSSENIISLLQEQSEGVRKCSDEYLLLMLETISAAISLEKFARKVEFACDVAAAAERDLRKSQLLTIAMASQQLLKRVEHETQRLRRTLKEHNGAERGWFNDASKDKKEVFHVMASEGYEEAWFDVADKTRSACYAMTFDTKPKNYILFDRSHWASIGVCALLSSALDLNIVVVVPDRNEKKLRFETFSATENKQYLDENTIFLYMLGNRDHFGYGVSRKIMHHAQKCFELESARDTSAVVEIMCNQFIANFAEQFVSHVYDEVVKWRLVNAQLFSPSTQDVSFRVVEQRLLSVRPTIRLTVASLLSSERVISKAWNCFQSSALPPRASNANLNVEKNMLSENVAQFFDENSAEMTVFLLSRKFNAMQNAFAMQIAEPTIRLVKQMFANNDIARDTANGLIEVGKLRSFPYLVEAISSAISLLVDNATGENIDQALIWLVETYNSWMVNEYEPLEKAIRLDCESALRFVIARMRHSCIQPGVVPLFILGEQTFFIDSRLFTLDAVTEFGPVRMQDLHIYQICTNESKSFTDRDIALGNTVARLDFGECETDFLQNFCGLVFDTLASFGTDTQAATNALLFATGVAYANNVIEYRMDQVQRVMYHSMQETQGNEQEECSVRNFGNYRQEVLRDGVVKVAGAIGIHLLAILEPLTCMKQQFGWLGAHLRCSAYYPAHGFVDLLGFHKKPTTQEEALEMLPRLALRFYVLYNTVVTKDADGHQKFGPLLLRSETFAHRIRPIDASCLLSRRYDDVSLREATLLMLYGAQGSVWPGTGFYGHAPTDWLFLHQLDSFFASNSSTTIRESLFRPGIHENLNWSLLFGSSDKQRTALRQALEIVEPAGEPAYQRMPFLNGSGSSGSHNKNTIGKRQRLAHDDDDDDIDDKPVRPFRIHE